MRLRTFTAKDMPGAMRMVREALGENAVILNTGKNNGKGMVTVTAAVEQELEDSAPAVVPPPQPAQKSLIRDDPQTDDLRFGLQNMLRFHNVPDLFIAKMMQRLPDSELAAIQALHNTGTHHASPAPLRLATEKLIGGYYTFNPLPLSGEHNKKIMLIGQPGAGKTLSIAKMAARLSMDKHPFAVITTDTQRAGGIGQLQAFTHILGVELHIAKNRKELAALLKDGEIQGHVLIDTAGCNPFAESELDELQTLATLPNVEPVLVMPAGGDSLEAIDLAEAFSVLPVKRLLVTRTDTARRFGGVLAAAAAHGLAFSHAGNSASPIDALQPLEPALLAQLLLLHISNNAGQQAYQLQTQ